MTDLEQRLRNFEDRAALEDVLLAYYAAVDSLSDLQGIVDCFTPDATFDLVDLGLPRIVGHDGIRAFFANVFRDTAHHAHHVTNFRVKSLAENEATARGYVIGRAEGHGGAQVLVYCCYDIAYVRTPAGWRMRLFDEGALIPFGAQIGALHSGH